MNPKLKLAAYAVLLILAIWFAWGFHSNYAAVNRAAARDAQASAASDDTGPRTAPAPAPDTNTNVAASTNQTTNAVASATNAATPGTNVVAVQSNVPPPAPTETKPPSPVDEAGSRGAMIGYLLALIGAIVGLGLMVAMDVTQFVGNQAVDFLFNDDGEGIRDPEYERAEQLWANGKHLEAIQLMRDFLKKNPRQLHAALRIAEIYEKDLHNYLAAALEYEEVIKHKLPAERWGWAAIHLCNLYSRIGQPDKTLVLLRRIVDEYPKTAAAKKARTRLGIAEPETESDLTEAESELEEPTAESEPAAPPEPPSNLPPGFRPKK